MASRAITLRFLGDTTSLNASFAQAQAGMTGLQARANSLGNRMYAAGSKMQAVGFAASRLAIPAAIAGAASVKLALDWEESLNKIQRLTQANEKQVEAWGEKIKKMAPELGKGPDELAEALYFVASSGAPVSEALNIVEMSARGSTAGLGKTADVAKAVTQVMNVYGAQNISAAKATDILTEAAKLGSAEAADYAKVIGRLTPTANLLGIEFNEMAAAMAVATNQGLSASEAATGIRQAMVALQKPTKAGAEILKENGTSMEAMRKIAKEKGLLAALREMKKVTGGNVESFQKLFPNIRGANAALILTSEEGAAMTNDVFGQMTDSTGELDKAFKKATETTKFKLNKALGELKTAGIEIGQVFLPVIEDVAKWATKVADSVGGMSKEKQKLIGWTILATAALGPMLRVFGNILKVFSVFAKHPAILVIIGLVALGKYLYDNWEPFKNVVDGVIDSLDKFVNKDFGKAVEEFKKKWDDPGGERSKGGWWERRAGDFAIGLRRVEAGFNRFIDNSGRTWLRFQDGWDRVSGWFVALWHNIVGWWDSLGLDSVFGGVWNYVAGIFRQTWQIIMGVWNIVSGAFTGDWTKVWEGVKGIFVAAWQFIAQVWGYTWRGIVEVVGGALGMVWSVITDAFGLITRFLRDRVTQIRSFFGGMWDNVWQPIVGVYLHVVGWFNNVVDFVRGLPGRIAGAAGGMWDGIRDSFRSALNWIIDRWNSLSFTLPSFEAFGQKIGGFTLSTPDIPRFAKGGIVDKPTLAIVGDGRGPEVMFPTDDPARGFDLLRQAGVLDRVNARGRGEVNVKVTNHITALDPREAARIQAQETMWILKSKAA